MPSRARSAAAVSAAPRSSPGMNRRTARRKNARSESWRASQVLRDARSKRRRAKDMTAKKYGDGRRGKGGGCDVDRCMIQLYHIYDTFALAVEYLEDALRSAPGAPPRAGRPAGLCADATFREPAGTAGGSLPGRRRAAGSGVRNLW